jgi:hypothetical protein
VKAKLLLLVLFFTSLLIAQDAKEEGFTSLPSLVTSPTTNPALCPQNYLTMIVDKELSVVVAFGYKDARPFRFVADRYEKMFFADRLTSLCEEGQFACGFERSAADSELFTKSVSSGTNTINVKIRLTTSSVGPDDEENRINPYQRWLSQRAETVFMEGLKSADVVLYSGHSRAGGGPDFRPPVLYKNDHVAYGLYKKKQPGLKMILDTLEKSKASPIKVLGLFSCASSQLFVNAVQQKRAGVGVISSSSLIYHADALQNMYMSLDSIIAGRCAKEFAEKIRSNDSRSGSKIIGFF